jgi:hypothetical protein
LANSRTPALPGELSYESRVEPSQCERDDVAATISGSVAFAIGFTDVIAGDVAVANLLRTGSAKPPLTTSPHA